VPSAFADITSKPTTLSGYGITDGAPLASPTFTGSPAAPTQSYTNKTTLLATTAFVSKLIHAGPQLSVNDDAVGDLMVLTNAGAGVASTGLLIIGTTGVSRLSLFAVGITGVNAISTVFLGAAVLNGGLSAGAPSSGAGTDGNLNVYIGDDDHIYVSNRLGGNNSISGVFIPFF
jgi:hypothetical protein